MARNTYLHLFYLFLFLLSSSATCDSIKSEQGKPTQELIARLRSEVERGVLYSPVGREFFQSENAAIEFLTSKNQFRQLEVKLSTLHWSPTIQLFDSQDQVIWEQQIIRPVWETRIELDEFLLGLGFTRYYSNEFVPPPFHSFRSGESRLYYELAAASEMGDDEFSLLQQQRTNQSRFRLGIGMAMYKRPTMTDFVMNYFQRLKHLLADEVDLVLLAVGSEGNASRSVAKRNGFAYLEYPNICLTFKYNALSVFAKNFHLDALLYAETDNLISPQLLLQYPPLLRKGAHFVGVRQFTFLLLRTGELIHYKGRKKFENMREEAVGMCRAFSASLLDAFDWAPWSITQTDAQDTQSWNTFMVKSLVMMETRVIIDLHQPLQYQLPLQHHQLVDKVDESYPFHLLEMRFNDAESLHPVENVVYVRFPDRITQYPNGFEMLEKVFGPDEVQRIQQLQLTLQQEEEEQKQQQRAIAPANMQICDEEQCHTAV